MHREHVALACKTGWTDWAATCIWHGEWVGPRESCTRWACTLAPPGKYGWMTVCSSYEWVCHQKVAVWPIVGNVAAIPASHIQSWCHQYCTAIKVNKSLNIWWFNLRFNTQITDLISIGVLAWSSGVSCKYRLKSMKPICRQSHTTADKNKSTLLLRYYHFKLLFHWISFPELYRVGSYP